MKRIYAAILCATVLAAALVVTIFASGDSRVVGTWEKSMTFAQRGEVTMRFTFNKNGTYACTVTEGDTQGTTSRGNYEAKGGKLYLSQGMEYKIDKEIYDVYRLEKGELVLVENSSGSSPGLYPMRFQRVEP